jgi:hypothetical protein
MKAKYTNVYVGFPALQGSPTPRLRLPLFTDEPSPPHAMEPKRRRIWELSDKFHCSIIGTCLTTTELRQLLAKLDLPGVRQETDHELHGRAVLLAGQKTLASKLLHKAIDRRHRSAVNQFAKARSADELRSLWDGAVQRAEIPGAYWAVLTHPETTEDVVRHVFGEVHMLSHLVGAANRADIRRLRQLEAENAALQEKVSRQQCQLRDAVVTREAIITGLRQALGRAAAASPPQAASPAGSASDVDRATNSALADLQWRLSRETSRREKMERRMANLAAERDKEKKQRAILERREKELCYELAAAEQSLSRVLSEGETADDPSSNLHGATLLYVGGRPHQHAQLRRLAEQWGANFVHHDGGIDDRSGLLESQVASAGVVLFPIDCVSHNAVAVIKRASRRVGKRFVPLRSSGLTSFVTALRTLAAQQSLGDIGEPANIATPLSSSGHHAQRARDLLVNQ